MTWDRPGVFIEVTPQSWPKLSQDILPVRQEKMSQASPGGLCDLKVISRGLLEIVKDVNLNKPFKFKSNAPIIKNC